MVRIWNGLVLLGLGQSPSAFASILTHVYRRLIDGVDLALYDGKRRPLTSWGSFPNLEPPSRKIDGVFCHHLGSWRDAFCRYCHLGFGDHYRRTRAAAITLKRLCSKAPATSRYSPRSAAPHRASASSPLSGGPMSAFVRLADTSQTSGDVRFVPKAAFCNAEKDAVIRSLHRRGREVGAEK